MTKFLLFFFLFTSGYCFSQMEENKMQWEEQKELNWRDFKGKPDANNPFHAISHTGFAFSWSLKSSRKGNEFKYDVKSYFYPDRSWVKTGTETDHLLAHEQLHFDISELHARKFRKFLHGIVVNKGLKNNLQAFYNETEKERRQMQEKFDMESQHSDNAKAEQQWQQFVKSELKKLKEFSS